MFPENLSVSRDEVEGNEIHCSPRDQSLSDLLYSKAKFENHAEIAAITCNSGQHFAGNSELFPFDVIGFAMLAAHGIWRETVVSLLDVM